MQDRQRHERANFGRQPTCKTGRRSAAQARCAKHQGRARPERQAGRAARKTRTVAGPAAWRQLGSSGPFWFSESAEQRGLGGPDGGPFPLPLAAGVKPGEAASSADPGSGEGGSGAPRGGASPGPELLLRPPLLQTPARDAPSSAPAEASRPGEVRRKAKAPGGRGSCPAPRLRAPLRPTLPAASRL
ncbi:Hypothetical predicted protein [Podarcis lilfordi]|uniref:Uncharacterized protein n=1 Tax=Podarcis lilfordi TaxID=74358 RepID=A0AA35LHJ4_9SAUR|nr:Hypothetical predicted protein [Podarcis lilfordi]